VRAGLLIPLILGSLLVLALLLGLEPADAEAGSDAFTPFTVTDQTPTEPLANPDPTSNAPRYISGFGSDDTFTVFFEDRSDGFRIYYNSTTVGPLGFTNSSTPTNVVDTHFVVKDWPITVGDTSYAYRAWGAVGNNPQHRFYVSNNLITWTLVSTFTIPNTPGFANARGWVYYGFHDVIRLNGTYYAFAESNRSQTMIVSSTNGADDWVAFASVGGRPGDGPLELPAGVSYGWTPTANFVDLGHDRGYGKIYADPRDSNFYLAINTAARASLPPADLEAAFIDPANWTWHDGSTGPAASPVLSETSEHDLRECWVVPTTGPDASWMVVYDADFGAGDGGKALGYAVSTRPTAPSPPGSTFYLPLVMGGFTPMPDLRVVSLTVEPATPVVGQPVAITVEVRNAGEVAAGPFWVDLYDNPDPPPTDTNQPWNLTCNGSLQDCYGVAWYIADGLGPGRSVVLTSLEGYAPAQTHWLGFFTQGGPHDLYAFADSWNWSCSHGAVLERHEGLDNRYGPVSVAVAPGAGGVTEARVPVTSNEEYQQCPIYRQRLSLLWVPRFSSSSFWPLLPERWRPSPR